jgi:hypothetical protein
VALGFKFQPMKRRPVREYVDTSNAVRWQAERELNEATIEQYRLQLATKAF